jgi:hypothetical protein
MIKYMAFLLLVFQASGALADGGDGWFCEPWVRSYAWTYDWEKTQRDGLDAKTESYKLTDVTEFGLIYDFVISAGFDLDSAGGEYNTYNVRVLLARKIAS